MNQELNQAMDKFLRRYQETHSAAELLQIEYDPSWPSPCMLNIKAKENV